MSWLDVTLLLAMFSYIWGGFAAGLIQSIGGVIGLLVGSFVASRWYEGVAPNLTPIVGGNELVGKIAAFIVIFFVATRVIALLFWFVNKLFNLIAIVPGLKLLNKFGGAVFGFLEGALFLGLTLQFVNRLPLPANWVGSLDASFMVPFLLGISGWLVPFLPKVLKEADKALDSVLPQNINVNSALKGAETIKNSGLLNSNLPL